MEKKRSHGPCLRHVIRTQKNGVQGGHELNAPPARCGLGNWVQLVLSQRSPDGWRSPESHPTLRFPFSSALSPSPGSPLQTPSLWVFWKKWAKPHQSVEMDTVSLAGHSSSGSKCASLKKSTEAKKLSCAHPLTTISKSSAQQLSILDTQPIS